MGVARVPADPAPLVFEQSFEYSDGVGWHNGPPSWAEMQRVLEGKPRVAGAAPESPADGGDSPAWSRKRVTIDR